MRMASLTQRIQFQSLFNQLDRNEFLLLMGKMFDTHRHLIAVSLFDYFGKPNVATIDLEQINSEISTIIRSRKTKPEEPINRTFKLETMPFSIIGYIASYSEQNDYFHFEQASRSIFIGCNAPNTLNELDLQQIKDYSDIDLEKYHSLKHIAIKVGGYHTFTFQNNGRIILSQLEALTLNNEFKKDCDLDIILNQHLFRIDNIKTLRMIAFGDIGQGNRFNEKKMLKFMKYFSNIKYLTLRNFFLQNPHDNAFGDALKTAYPHLEGLVLNGGSPRRCSHISNTFSNNLESLYYGGTLADFGESQYGKLKELILSTDDPRNVDRLFESAKKLQKVLILPSFKNKHLSKKKVKSMIPLIFNCQSLEYFGIAVNSATCSLVFEAIERALFKTGNMTRKNLKIEIFVDKSKVDIDETLFNMHRVIKSLHCLNEGSGESKKIVNFMFILNFKGACPVQNAWASKLIDGMDRVPENVAARCYTGNHCFVVMNRGCALDRFRERWMTNVTMNDTTHFKHYFA